MSKFITHKSVKILTGAYAGLAGAVVESNDEKQTIKVSIQGVLKDKEIDKIVSLKYAQVEVL
jgi:transcription antitermination factor NusG